MNYHLTPRMPKYGRGGASYSPACVPIKILTFKPLLKNAGVSSTFTVLEFQ